MKKIFICLSLLGAMAIGGAAFAEEVKDGPTLYKNCMGCHGVDGGKISGGAKTLRGLSSEQLLADMKGYLDGSFGGDRKNVMQAILKKFSEQELQTLANYIPTLPAEQK